MPDNEKQQFQKLLDAKDYKRLYQTQAPVLNQMLLINSEEEFDDYLEYLYFEDWVFWMHYQAFHGEVLLIGGYDGDVTEAVKEFLKSKLPDNVFESIKNEIGQIYADVDEWGKLDECVDALNNSLEKNGYSILLDHDDLYSAGEYFLSVKRLYNSANTNLRRTNK